MYMYVCVEAKIDSILFLVTGALTGLEFSVMVRLSGQQTPGICLSSPQPQYWGHVCAPRTQVLHA